MGRHDPSNPTWGRLRIILSDLSPPLSVGVFALLMFPPLADGQDQTIDRVLYRDGFLQVVSPDRVSEDRARVAAKKAMDAWEFDFNLMHWANPAEIQKPFTLRFVDDARMNQESPGSRAYAHGDRFTVRMSLIDDPSLVRTFAHELGHIQASRALAGHSVPRYFLEGHGLMLNQLYSDRLGQDRRVPGAAQVRTMMALTEEEAWTILTDEARSLQEPNTDVTGLFFVEYLRARKKIPDAIPKMGRVFELVGSGRTYAQAFQQTYGFPLWRTVSEIVGFLERTKAHPAERIIGTRYEEYLPGNGVTAPAREVGAGHL